jgi:hypothetical protein
MKGVIDRRMRGRRRSRAAQVARLGEDRRKFDAPDLRVIRHCVEHRRDQFFEEARRLRTPDLYSIARSAISSNARGATTVTP